MPLRDLILAKFFGRSSVDMLEVALLNGDREVRVDGYRRIPAVLSEWRVVDGVASKDVEWDGFAGDVSFDAVALMVGQEVVHLFPQGKNTVAAGNPIGPRLRVTLDDV